MENVVFLMICMEKWWCVGGLVRWGVVHLKWSVRGVVREGGFALQQVPGRHLIQQI